MTNNSILPNLENRTVQNLPIKLIYAHNDYNVFDKGATEFYGEYDEYISDQPIEDKIQWKKELTEKDLKKIPAVFKCRLGIIVDQVLYTAYNKKKIRQSLQGPAHEAALLSQLVDSLKTQGQIAINEKLTEVVCEKENYKENTGWEEVDANFANIDSQDKAIAFLQKIKDVYHEMDEITTKYNKGYQIPGDNTWHAVKTNCETPQSKVLLINPEILDRLEIFFLADVNRDSNLNPNNLFKKVIKRKLKNNVLCSIQDEKSVVYRIINDEEGIKEAETLGGGMKKFAWNSEVTGGMLTYTNAWALVKKAS